MYQAANNNLERTLKGIIYIDEVDKLAKNFTFLFARRFCEGVQQALLKILEGTTCNVRVRGNKRLPNQESIQVDDQRPFYASSFEGLGRLI